jgi:hypothetical protein
LADLMASWLCWMVLKAGLAGAKAAAVMAVGIKVVDRHLALVVPVLVVQAVAGTKAAAVLIMTLMTMCRFDRIYCVM